MPVLEFNPTDRTSSRRLAARKDTIALYIQAQQAQAAALGLDQDERDDFDLYAHFHIILDVEAAYGKGRKEGRDALMAVIKSSYNTGTKQVARIAPCRRSAPGRE